MFETALKELNIASKRSDIALMEAENLLSSSIDDLELFRKKAKQKVMMENGTAEDLAYLESGASEGFIVRAKEVIKKAIEAVKEFFKTLRKKIIALFAEKDIDANLEKVETKIKRNPFLKNKKIKTVDADKIENCTSEHVRNTKKILAKAKSGGSINADDIEEEEKSFDKKWKIAAGATVTVGAGALIAMIRSRRKRINEEVSSTEDELMEKLGDHKKRVEKLTDPEVAANFTRAISATVKATKLHAESFLNSLLRMWLDLKNAITHSKEADADVYDESALDELDECGEGLEACAGLDCDDEEEFVDAFNDASEDEGDSVTPDDVEDDMGVDDGLPDGEIADLPLEEASDDEADDKELEKEAKEFQEFAESVDFDTLSIYNYLMERSEGDGGPWNMVHNDYARLDNLVKQKLSPIATNKERYSGEVTDDIIKDGTKCIDAIVSFGEKYKVGSVPNVDLEEFAPSKWGGPRVYGSYYSFTSRFMTAVGYALNYGKTLSKEMKSGELKENEKAIEKDYATLTATISSTIAKIASKAGSGSQSKAESDNTVKESVEEEAGFSLLDVDIPMSDEFTERVSEEPEFSLLDVDIPMDDE